MIIILFFLIFVEIISIILIKFTRFKKIELRVEQSLINKNYKFIFHPYTFYWNNNKYKNYKKNKFFFDKNGYRSSRILKKKNILVLGDSTSESLPYEINNNNIWTSIVNNFLKEKNIQLINASLNSATSYELLFHFLSKGQFYYPKIIIFYAGINDMYPILDKNFKSDYSHSKEYNFFSLRHYEKILINNISVLKLIFLFLVRKKNLDSIKQYSFNEKKINVIFAKKKILKNKFYVLENNILNLLYICKKRGIKLILIPPIINDEKLNSLRLKNIISLSCKMILKIMERISKKKGLNCHLLKVEDFNKKTEFFRDYLHFNSRGHLQFAKIIYNFINKNILKN